MRKRIERAKMLVSRYLPPSGGRERLSMFHGDDEDVETSRRRKRSKDNEKKSRRLRNRDGGGQFSSSFQTLRKSQAAHLEAILQSLQPIDECTDWENSEKSKRRGEREISSTLVLSPSGLRTDCSSPWCYSLVVDASSTSRGESGTRQPERRNS